MLPRWYAPYTDANFSSYWLPELSLTWLTAFQTHLPLVLILLVVTMVYIYDIPCPSLWPPGIVLGVGTDSRLVNQHSFPHPSIVQTWIKSAIPFLVVETVRCKTWGCHISRQYEESQSWEKLKPIQREKQRSKRVLVVLKFLVLEVPEASVHHSPHPLCLAVQPSFGFLELILILHFCPSKFKWISVTGNQESWITYW